MGWVVNYNGKVLDFKYLRSGYIPIKGGIAYFYREGRNKWRVNLISDVSNQDVVKKLIFVNSKSGGRVNLQFMDLLDNEFPSSSMILTDNEMYGMISSRQDEVMGGGKVSLGNYVSDVRSVIVDNQRYYNGEVFYRDGNRYKVTINEQGEGYVVPDLCEGSFRVEEGTRKVREHSHILDYRNVMYNYKPLMSSIYVDYDNYVISRQQNQTIISDHNAIIQRRLKATELSDLRYWECFSFSPGYETEVKLSRGTEIGLEEGRLTSKGSLPQTSFNYGDWVIPVSTGPIDKLESYGKTKYIALKNLPNIRNTSERPDVLFFKKVKGGFKVVRVKDFFLYGGNYRKVLNLYKKYNHFNDRYSDAFLDALIANFGYTFWDYSRAARFLGARPPKNYAPAPHIKPGSGKKEKIFAAFKAYHNSFSVRVRYSTFLRYSKNKDTMSRGKAKLQLVRLTDDGGYQIVDTIFNVDYNVGNYFSPEKGKWITKKYESKPVGRYAFRLYLEDTYQDIETIGVRAYPKITQFKVSPKKYYDDSVFQFYVVDAKTGKLVKDVEILKGKEIKKCFRVVVPRGEEYVIVGKLLKGHLSVGGYLNNGGSVKLTEGVIKYDVIERSFPTIIGQEKDMTKFVPMPEWDFGDIDIEESDSKEGKVTDPYCWIDVIKITKQPLPKIDEKEKQDFIDQASYYPEGVDMKMKLLSGDLSSKEREKFLDLNKDYLDYSFNDDIDFTLVNPLDKPVELKLRFDVDGGDGEHSGIINYYGSGFEYKGYGDFVGEGVERKQSYVDVKLTEYVSESDIVGGCDGSYATVRIKSGDNVIKSIDIQGDGWIDFNTGNLWDYGYKDYVIEIETHQNGAIDPNGYDLRTTFLLSDFNIFTSYELSAANFDSMLDFYINDEKKLSLNTVGEGKHYFPVKKGKNKYKFVFSTNHWDYNWDYAEIPWIRLTNWICDDITVVPYCEPAGGDKCIEALIGCVLGLLPKPKPKGCVIINYINNDTKEVMKHIRLDGYKEGEYTFKAPSIPDFKIVGEASKTVYVDEGGECAEVSFYYTRVYRDCIYVLYIDKTTGNVLLKKEYHDLLPGIYTFSAKEFSGYKLISNATQKVNVRYLEEPQQECKLVIFEYERDFIPDRNLECIHVIHVEDGNSSNVLLTESLYDLAPGKYVFYSKDFEGYEVVNGHKKEVILEGVNEPITECRTIIFKYRKIKLDCVVVKFKDKLNNKILDTDYYWNLPPGKYTFEAKKFDEYQLVDDEIKTILIKEENIQDRCKEVVFLYEPIVNGCVFGKKIWLFT